MSDIIEIEANLSEYEGADKIVHFTTHQIEKAAEFGKSKKFKSNFPGFDEKMGGLDTGEVIIVSGQTKMGKTLFAESWIHSMMLKDPECKSLLFSYEIETEKLLIKYQSEPGLPIYVPMSLKMVDFEWLKNRCHEGKLKFGCNVVLIDHLHFCVDMNVNQNMSLNIGAFMRRLKREIAMDFNMAIILIAHQGMVKEGQTASINSLRDSSFIGQESDATIIVDRRKNLKQKDLDGIEKRYGAEKMFDIKYRVKSLGIEDDDMDDYSDGFATIKIDVHRRTGVFGYKKLFQKVGDFMEEV